EAICLKCLEKDPRRRYTSALELAEDLEAWLAGLPTRARPLTRRERFVRWCHRNPVLTGAAAALLATIATAFILIMQSRDEAVRVAGENEARAEKNAELARQKDAEAKENKRLEKVATDRANDALTEKKNAIDARLKTTAGRAGELLGQGIELCER